MAGALVGAVLLSATAASAEVRQHQLGDDGRARTGDYLRFDLRSVKAGFISTGVEGHVRRFDVAYELEDGAAREVRVSFPVRAMTTNNGGRDEKMWTYCLGADDHPRIDVAIPGPIAPGFSGELPARIRVRGTWRPIRLHVTARPDGDATIVEGRARVSLSRLGIPDPSIWIARVDDAVGIAFRARLTGAPEGRS